MTGYLTVRQTAEVLNMHFMSVYKLVQTGQLPALKIGSRWKIDPDQLEGWLARRSGLRRLWLAVGLDEATTATLARELGAAHEVRAVGFQALAGALDEGPEAVLLEAARDPQLALAALALCRERSQPPVCVLVLGRTDAALVGALLADGPVTLMPAPLRPDRVARLTELVTRN